MEKLLHSEGAKPVEDALLVSTGAIWKSPVRFCTVPNSPSVLFGASITVLQNTYGAFNIFLKMAIKIPTNLKLFSQMPRYGCKHVGL